MSTSLPSTVFASRELNGEVLLSELATLRAARVPPAVLNELVLLLQHLEGIRAVEATVRLKQLAGGRFATSPALASLLMRWAGRLKADSEVPVFIAHFERLAITAAIFVAMRQGVEQLKGKGKG